MTDPLLDLMDAQLARLKTVNPMGIPAAFERLAETLAEIARDNRNRIAALERQNPQTGEGA